MSDKLTVSVPDSKARVYKASKIEVEVTSSDSLKFSLSNPFPGNTDTLHVTRQVEIHSGYWTSYDLGRNTE